MKLNFVFENTHFVILDKPAMVLTTPSREGKEDERLCLGIELQNQLQQQIFPVHRLDFEVSGLVLFAKTAEAHSKANTWFETKQVFKTYQAFSEGQSFTHIPDSVKNPRLKIEPKADEKFLWKSRLLRGKKRAYDHATGKPSETEAVYLGFVSAKKWHHWELHPLTGRPHQLRFELSTHGFPIVGDQLYGAKTAYTQPGIALRAVKIDFSKTPGAKNFELPEVVEVPGFIA
jgi:tRNA pseudouridine32 synthase/23S rRNA pseudouridine746 synthase